MYNKNCLYIAELMLRLMQKIPLWHLDVSKYHFKGPIKLAARI